MKLGFGEEQEELRRYAIEWLAKRSSSETVRRLMESDDGFDPGAWKEMAELGWLGLAIPEEHGGSGFGFREQAVLLEEMGRLLLPSPFLSTVVLGVGTLLSAGDDRSLELLPSIAAGDLRVALAGTDGVGEVAAAPSGDAWRLTGNVTHVVDGHTADLLVVPASTDDGLTLFLLERGGSGVTTHPLGVLDQTRKQAQISLTDAPAHTVLGEVGAGASILGTVMAKAVVAVTLEQVGGAQRCLDMSVEYAKTRHQFGRPIGSFQAIKHKCADMLVMVESARSAAYYAAWAADDDPEELAVLAPLAKSYCSEAYLHCAGENIQIHGGIGFTWEHDAHLYLKRAKSSQLMFGDPVYHRQVLADRLGL